MFGPFAKSKTPDLDEAIDTVMHAMRTTDVDSEEYPKLLRHLERLHELKNGNIRKPVSTDAVITSLGSLCGIFIIVAYEQHHVITTKALSLISKFK